MAPEQRLRGHLLNQVVTGVVTKKEGLRVETLFLVWSG